MTEVAAALGAFIAAALVTAGSWRLAADQFRCEAFARRNYRDASVVTSVGILIAVAVTALVAVASLLRAGGVAGMRPGDPLAVLVSHGPILAGLVVGFGALGLLDDVAGVGQSGGFRGHLAALLHGHLTSGGIKLLGGGAVAVALLAPLGDGVVALLRAAAIVSLAANLANLFDRGPGRVVKVAALWWVVISVAGGSRASLIGALPAGGAIGLLAPDLREELMLGDAGSNAVGAGLGFAVIVDRSPAALWVILAALLVANLLSEVVSYSRVIDAIGPLRALDRLGSRRPR